MTVSNIPVVIRVGWLMIAALSLFILPARAQSPLTEDAFKTLGSGKGIVIMQVNWGRYWKCGAYENAQLQKLVFERVSKDGEPPAKGTWELAPASVLNAKSTFEPYVVMLDPGEYVLSAFRFKLAKSATNVRIAEPGPAELIVNGQPVGGSFTVNAGEAVYVGHFGVDCHGEPSPWRFYVEDKADFAKYVDGFHQRYPFAKDLPVTFRLFQTTRLGQPFELPQ